MLYHAIYNNQVL